jgi:hypothetical protein
MNREDIENLALGVGMIRMDLDGVKPLWTASNAQLGKLVETVVAEVKQSASEYVVRAIKKAVEYERAECAKLAGYVSKEAAKSIREREND